MHNGAQYEVLELNEDGLNPYLTVQEVRTNEYSDTISEKTVRDLDPEATHELGNGYRLAWGAGTVEIHYTYYQRKSIKTGNVTTSMQPTGLDPITLRTHLMWIEAPPSLRDDILWSLTSDEPSALSDGEVKEIFGGGLHGAEHGMIKLTPLVLRMDSSDLGGLSTPLHEETGVPTVFIHDVVEGGLGFSKRLYAHVQTIAEQTRDRVVHCDCTGTGGCPACIMDLQCGNRNQYLHTEATVLVLDRLFKQLAIDR